MLLAQVLIVIFLLDLLLPKRLHLVAILGGLLILIPLPEVSPAMALRGLWGDPSITTLQLLVLSLVSRRPKAFTEDWQGPALIAFAAALFYPLSLGLGDFDPYRLGYQPWRLILVLTLPALYCWWRGHNLWLWLLSIDILAWAAGLLESPNFWDTLLDPLLAVACLYMALRNAWRRWRRPPPAPSTEAPADTPT
ncbi:hypothetical protein DLREEDagrD3_07220 [Denitratisoma sp. agr-D3]